MIKKVNLLIGSACNMKCGYCLQTNEKSPADHKADLLFFVKNFSELYKDHPIEKIGYWGGEPMLYWEQIKTVHSELTRLGIAPKKSIITTNGKLLTKDYVDYVNSNPDIFTVVSWHEGDFSDEQLDLIFKLKNFSISILVHHHRTELWDVRDLYWKLREKFKRQPRTCVHFLRANDGCNPDYYMTKEDVDKFCQHLEVVIKMAQLGDEWARWQCSQLIFLRNTVKHKDKGPLCVRDDTLSVDLHGNTYACHHNYDSSNITGNIFKKVIPIKSVQQFSPVRFYSSEECQKCDCLEECRGGCYTSNTHDVDCYFARKKADIFKRMERLFR